MAQTTIELRRLMALPGFSLFDFTYKFDDAAFKAQLEQYIIDYFYDMEIAFETPDMFKRKFQTRWQRIIPYYNKLYNTTLLQYNPMINSKMTEALEQLATSSSTQDSTTTTTDSGTSSTDGTSIVDQTTTNNGTSTTDSNSKSSDYPQQSIGAGNYLNGETDTTSSTTTNDNGTNDSTTTTDTTTTTSGEGSAITSGEASSTNNSNYTKTIEGMTGTTYQALIAAERENLLRIQDLIIAEMKPCFMMVY